MQTKINTIDRAISQDGLDDVCITIHYSFTKQLEKTAAVDEVLYAEGDEIPEGSAVGDVKTPAQPATYYSASSIGTVGLDAPDADNFTAYADITEADAIAWCEAKIGAERMAEIEAGLDARLAEQETPTRAKGVPWNGS